MTATLPDEFGKYAELSLIGEGGFGVVYRARDTKLERLVALKVLHRQLLSDPAFLQRFRQEAKVAAQLDHPNIVRIYEIDDFEGSTYLAMEYVPGQTLADLLQERGRLTPEDALFVVEALGSALDVAHAKGIIHRDIKPENILLREDGRVLVTDFGLARATEASFAQSLSSTGVVVGTYRYMAPEQTEFGAQVDGRADVYSLGVVLYEMVTGRLPFQGDSAAQLIRGHVLEPPEPPSNIVPTLPLAVESVILKALQKEPAERFASTGEMARALRAAIEDGTVIPGVYPAKKAETPAQIEEETPAPPKGPEPPAPPPDKPHKLRTALLVGAVVAFFALVVVLLPRLLGSGSSPEEGAVVAVVTDTATAEPTATQTPDATATKTLTPTPVPTATPTPTATPSQTPSRTHTPTSSPSPNATATAKSQVTRIQAAVHATLTAEATASRDTSATPTAAPDVTPQQFEEIDPATLTGLRIVTKSSSESGIGVEIKYADGTPKTNSWVGIYEQDKDVSGNPIRGKKLADGRTSDGGSRTFALEPGVYAVVLGDLVGVPWGEEFNYEVEARQYTVLSLTLGRLVIGMQDADGHGLKNKWTGVYLQDTDIGGNVIKGKRIADRRTNDAGLVTYDLTPGVYALGIGDIIGDIWGEELNHVVRSGEDANILVTLGRLTVGVTDADGKAVSNRWVGVYYQGEDLEGNPLRGDRFTDGRTNNGGLLTKDITAGTYVVEIGDLHGYEWGERFNHEIVSGGQTSIKVELGRITVGVKNAVGEPISNRWVGIYTQKEDLEGSPIKDKRVRDGRTDSTGLISFDLTPGDYAVEIHDVRGDLWGEELNHTVNPSDTTPIILTLGRLTIGLKDSNGNPITNRQAKLYYQDKDVSGNIIKGDRFVDGRTNSAGLLSWDLTAGHYVLEVSEIGTILDVEIRPGYITTSDGKSTTLREP